MIKHVVFIKWHQDITDEQINQVEDALSSLVEKMEFIVSYEYGPAIKLSPGEFDYALVAEFDTEDDFNDYANNPEHLLTIKNIISPLMDRYTALQFIC